MRLRNATWILILVNVVVFALQYFIPGFTESYALVSSDVFQRPWILLTSMFLHGGPWHLLFNMYALFLFGSLIEQRIGTKRFLGAYLVSGLIASFVASFFYPTALGASGAIMAVLGLTIMLLPDLQVLFFFVVPMSMRTAGVIFALIDIFGLFHDTGIAHAAHLAGLACGLFYGGYLLQQKKEVHKMMITPKKKSKHPHADLDEEDLERYLQHGRL